MHKQEPDVHEETAHTTALRPSSSWRRHARFFRVPGLAIATGFGSRRLRGRRRKPSLEPAVRSSRFVIVREIQNATPFGVATSTRTILPFQKMPNATPAGLFPNGTRMNSSGQLKARSDYGTETFTWMQYHPARDPSLVLATGMHTLSLAICDDFRCIRQYEFNVCRLTTFCDCSSCRIWCSLLSNASNYLLTTFRVGDWNRR